MTLEELQTEFPHGSRWCITMFKPNGAMYTVAAHHEHGGVVLLDGSGIAVQRQPHILLGQWERIPDPVPCPITEPTTLTRFSSGYIGIKGMATDGVGEIGITLHPAEPGATEGRYTWDGA